MGLLNLFTRSTGAVQKLPAGSFTVDRDGNVVTSTVSSSYPAELLGEVAREVLGLFREARRTEVRMTELTLNFASLQITAKELRGGAIVFLSPKTDSPKK